VPDPGSEHKRLQDSYRPEFKSYAASEPEDSLAGDEPYPLVTKRAPHGLRLETIAS